MRVLQVIPSFLPATRYGGPTQSVLRLCQGLQQAGVDVDIITSDGDGPGYNMDVEHGHTVAVDGVPVRYLRRFPKWEYGPSAELVRHAWSTFSDYDLIHVTPLFTFYSTVAPLIAQRLGVPYVVSPRGMCLPWALRRRPWKKLPYWWIVERRNLRRALALHATGEHEEEELRALFPNADVFNLPNAIDLPTAPPDIAPTAGRVVFLGRLHPVKGFDILIPALSELAARRPDVELIVAGPDDHGEWARTLERIERCEPRPKVTYRGSVHGQDKAALLASSEVLVLCSHMESFGNVVAEAMACGTPVVVSKNCPWSAVEEAGAGYWVNNTPGEVAGAIERVLASNGGMREAASRLSQNYTVASVGAAMASRYAELLRLARPRR